MKQVSPLRREEGNFPCDSSRRPITHVKVCTWNVEGLTDIKIYEICTYMRANRIDVLCMQETRKLNSDTYVSDTGYQVILSGGASGNREWAGVRFIISPIFRNAVVGITPKSPRVASIVYKTSGLKHAIICVYAPHNMRTCEEKVHFYDDLGIVCDALSINGCKFIAGDFNARLGCCRDGEETVLGEYHFGREAQHPVPLPNRDLLLEFCLSRGLFVANTFFHNLPEQRITFCEPGVAPLGPLNENTFALLDLFVVPVGWDFLLQAVASDRTVSIALHHFPVTATISTQADSKPAYEKKMKRDWGAMKDS